MSSSSPNPTPPALSVENIEVVYHHTVQVLRGLSLAVPERQIVALLGSNGAGKTTTLKAISGLLPLEVGQVRAGAIRWRGERINDVAPHLLARRGIAHVREGRHVFEDLTVDENLVAASFALDGRPGAGKGDTALIYEYFPRLKERRAQRAGYLSGGEQQMLAIGRALLLVEQNAMAAFGIAHYGYIMESGKVVIDGPTDKLVNDADVQRFYLGYGEGGQDVSSFRDVKHYKRRKRWLS